jgi:RNA polymerase subunit RPABC4/transcription elongation factor Spt4
VTDYLCQDCLRVSNQVPCPACGGDTCACGDCQRIIAQLRAGIRDWRVLCLQKPITAWSEEGGAVCS